MNSVELYYLAIVLVFTLSLTGNAAGETVYLTDQFQAGLHEDKSVDSPIVKTIPTGSALDIIKREKNFTYVRDPQGVSGWIDNSYLVGEAPEKAEIDKLKSEKENFEKKLDAATKQITRLEKSLTDSGQDNQSDLQQQLNSERLKTGELQIQLAELKKRLGANNDTESLYQQIEDLKEKNKTLEIQLTAARNQAGSGDSIGEAGQVSDGSVKQDWKRKLLYFLIYILIGMVIGIYAMDFYNRRRHGGLRV